MYLFSESVAFQVLKSRCMSYQGLSGPSPVSGPSPAEQHESPWGTGDPYAEEMLGDHCENMFDGYLAPFAQLNERNKNM